MNIKVIFEKGGKFIVKHAPTILTSVGILGYAGATAFAINEAPKAKKALEDLKKEKPDANLFDKAKTILPIYWPMGTMFIASTGCVIFAHRMDLKRLAELIALYKLSEDKNGRIEEEMRKLLGNTKTEEILDASEKDIVKSAPLSDQLIIQTGKGNTRFMDGLTRQRFNSSPQAVGEAFNNLNHRLMIDNTVCVNELLDELGLLPMDPKYVLGIDVGGGQLGDRLGWRLDDMSSLIKHKITYVNDEDGEPIGIITYDIGPSMWFDNNYYD